MTVPRIVYLGHRPAESTVILASGPIPMSAERRPVRPGIDGVRLVGGDRSRRSPQWAERGPSPGRLVGSL
ncbi:hypothetical protein E0504_38955 [Parafrankia sp. BMG5.11]|nr:hypothetical protein E0504_38955 [Parafrankia sp. BMG5.11]